MNNNNIQVSKSFDEIKKELSLHVSNKYLFRKDQIRVYNGITFNELTDWSSKNMRRIYFSDCKFTGVNLQSTGLTASIFKNCEFNGKNFDFTIFDEALFIDCIFNHCSFKATSFCKSEFVNCKMYQVRLNACFFTDAIFNGFEFSDCEITDIIWENSKFKKCIFDNVTLKKLNFEFTYFEDIHFNNTAIPFASLPFILGGFPYIVNTKDNIFIKTIHPSYSNQHLSKEQYLELLPDLLVFYQKTSNFFPLANVYLGLGNIDEGLKALTTGLEFWFGLHNYKMMYYFCDLANIYNLSIFHRRNIFSTVEKCNSWNLVNEKWDSQKQWNVHYCKMRDCLLNSPSVPYVTLQFSTSINADNYVLLAEFMQTIDTLLLPQNGYYSLEIRHNSPFELLYTFFADESVLFNAIVGIITILGVCDQLYSNHLKDKIDKKKQEALPENQQNQIDNVIKRNVTNITYNFYNCNISDLETDHFTRQSMGCVKPESSGNSQ